MPLVATLNNDHATHVSEEIESSCAKVTINEKLNDNCNQKLLEALKLKQGDLSNSSMTSKQSW